MADTYFLENEKVIIKKDPNATLDYTFDWSTYLSDISDTIATAVISADTGITIVSQSNTTTTATAWLSGGTVGTDYAIQCRITTANATARIDDRTIYVRIVEK